MSIQHECGAAAVSGGRPRKEAFMATIMPQSELVRRAAAYVAAELAEKGRAGLYALLDEASMRFNLTPLDQQALERLFTTQAGERSVMPSPVRD